MKHRKLAAFILIILSSQSLVNANDGNGFVSLEASLISFVDFNMGLFFINGGSIRGKGFDISLNPGLASSNIQFGYGHYEDGGSCGLPSIISGDVLLGRTYIFNGIIDKNEFYAGLQIKLSLTIAALRLGVIVSDQKEIRPNLGIGVGL